MRQIYGIHHVTAVTSSSQDIYKFFTYVLGMRLVKKTVNQDDVKAYHLFFADEEGSAGTDMTFFHFTNARKAVHGTNEIYRTGLRVADDEALRYWEKRFDHYQVKHEPIKEILGRKFLYFQDFDEQLYALVSDENIPGVAAGKPWKKGPVPDEYAIIGLGPIFIRVSHLDVMSDRLVNYLGMRLVKKEGSLSLFEMGEGGNGAGVIVDFQRFMPPSQPGYGTVHHVAFRLPDVDTLHEWRIYLNEKKIPNSGYVNRFYFESLYTRLYPNVLFEFATDGPGFIDAGISRQDDSADVTRLADVVRDQEGNRVCHGTRENCRRSLISSLHEATTRAR
jgi:glyoxalase family protein